MYKYNKPKFITDEDAWEQKVCFSCGHVHANNQPKCSIRSTVAFNAKALSDNQPLPVRSYSDRLTEGFELLDPTLHDHEPDNRESKHDIDVRLDRERDRYYDEIESKIDTDELLLKATTLKLLKEEK